MKKVIIATFLSFVTVLLAAAALNNFTEIIIRYDYGMGRELRGGTSGGRGGRRSGRRSSRSRRRGDSTFYSSFNSGGLHAMSSATRRNYGVHYYAVAGAPCILTDTVCINEDRKRFNWAAIPILCCICICIALCNTEFDDLR